MYLLIIDATQDKAYKARDKGKAEHVKEMNEKSKVIKGDAHQDTYHDAQTPPAGHQVPTQLVTGPYIIPQSYPASASDNKLSVSYKPNSMAATIDKLLSGDDNDQLYDDDIDEKKLDANVASNSKVASDQKSGNFKISEKKSKLSEKKGTYETVPVQNMAPYKTPASTIKYYHTIPTPAVPTTSIPKTWTSKSIAFQLIRPEDSWGANRNANQKMSAVSSNSYSRSQSVNAPSNALHIIQSPSLSAPTPTSLSAFQSNQFNFQTGGRFLGQSFGSGANKISVGNSVDATQKNKIASNADKSWWEKIRASGFKSLIPTPTPSYASSNQINTIVAPSKTPSNDMQTIDYIFKHRPDSVDQKKSSETRFSKLVSVSLPPVSDQAQVTDAKFTDAKFTDAKFTDAKFTDAKFTDAKFTDAKFTDAKNFQKMTIADRKKTPKDEEVKLLPFPSSKNFVIFTPPKATPSPSTLTTAPTLSVTDYKTQSPQQVTDYFLKLLELAPKNGNKIMITLKEPLKSADKKNQLLPSKPLPSSASNFAPASSWTPSDSGKKFIAKDASSMSMSVSASMSLGSAVPMSASNQNSASKLASHQVLGVNQDNKQSKPIFKPINAHQNVQRLPSASLGPGALSGQGIHVLTIPTPESFHVNLFPHKSKGHQLSADMMTLRDHFSKRPTHAPSKKSVIDTLRNTFSSFASPLLTRKTGFWGSSDQKTPNGVQDLNKDGVSKWAFQNKGQKIILSSDLQKQLVQRYQDYIKTLNLKGSNSGAIFDEKLKTTTTESPLLKLFFNRPKMEFTPIRKPIRKSEGANPESDQNRDSNLLDADSNRDAHSNLDANRDANHETDFITSDTIPSFKYNYEYKLEPVYDPDAHPKDANKESGTIETPIKNNGHTINGTELITEKSNQEEANRKDANKKDANRKDANKKDANKKDANKKDAYLEEMKRQYSVGSNQVIDRRKDNEEGEEIIDAHSSESRPFLSLASSPSLVSSSFPLHLFLRRLIS